MDRVVVSGLRVFGYHGAARIEREHGQYFVVDLEARMNLRAAGQTDLLGKTLDYDVLIKEATNIISLERYTLIEALAERLAAMVLTHPGVQAAVVRVSKPRPPIEADIESLQVEIHRTR